MAHNEATDTQKRIVLRIDWEVSLAEMPEASRLLNEAAKIGRLDYSLDTVTRAHREVLNEREARLIEHGDEEDTRSLAEQMETFHRRLPFTASPVRDGFESK